MSAPAPAVACRGITKSFGKTAGSTAGKLPAKAPAKAPALADLNLTVAPGEKVALLGASGAGKTTLLNICAGQLTPDSGSAALFGQDPSQLNRKARAQLVGLMSQRLDLVGPLRARHNIQAGLLGRWGLLTSLAALTLPLESPAARAVADQLNLGNKLAQRTFTLSGGEQQRVAAARLLLQSPAVLLADEPVASLDINLADTVLSLLTQDDDQTVLMSLHNPNHALAYADRILGLREGRLAFDLPSEQTTQLQLKQLYDPAAI